MKVKFLKRTLVAAVISAVSLLGMSMPANARQQSHQGQKQQNKRQGQKQQKEQPRAQRQQQRDQGQEQPRAQRQEQRDQDQGQQRAQKQQKVKQEKQQVRVTDRRQERQEQRAQQAVPVLQQKQGRPPGWDRGKKVGWGNSNVPPGQRGRLPEQRQKELILRQQRQLTQYRQYLDQQQRLADQRTVLLQQQRRMAQYRYQQQYFERLRQQQMLLQSEQHDYYGDPYYYTAPSYRYIRGGSYYETNQYGADQLRQAVNNGYEQGFRAGEADRQDRYSGRYQDSYAYRDANYGYNGYYVNQADYNYYFRQGFRRGYEDGYNSRSQYGSQSNGKYSILGTILSQILNLQSLR